MAEIAPLMLATLRIGIGALILNVLLLFTGSRLGLSLEFWKNVFIAGFFAQGLPFILINWGEQYVDSSLASVLNGLVPIFTILLAHLMTTDERLSVNKIKGVMMGFVGLVILVLPSLYDGVDGSLAGIVSITIASVSYAIGIVYIRKYLVDIPSFQAPAAQLLSVTIYLVPLTLFVYQEFDFQSISAIAWGSTMILGVIGTAIAFVIYFKLIEQSSAGYASLVTYIMPLFGVLLGVMILDESLTLWVIAGATFILFGIKLTRTTKRSKPKHYKVSIDPALYSKFR